MKKFSLINFLTILSIFCANAQLLWKVEGNGLTKPSYIMGTYHLAKTSFVDSIAGLKKALAESEQVYGEIDMQSQANVENIQKMQAAMLLPEGKTIDALLTNEQLERLNEFMRKYLGADFSNPLLAPMKQMTPAALSTQFQVLITMKMEENFNPQEQFDSYFQQEARKDGKFVGGFETIDYQIKVLLGGSTIERQIEQLMCLVDNADYQKEVIARTVKAYYSQNLDSIDKINEEKLHNSCDLTPAEEDALIYSRNIEWENQLQTIMKEKATFIAVGAAHLPGERGLLNLLRTKGYSVNAVK